MKKIVLCYVPVIHQGYISFFEKYEGDIYLIGQDVIDDLAKEKGYYGRDFRAVNPEHIHQSLQVIFPERNITIATQEVLARLNKEEEIQCIAPLEDIIQDIHTKYLPNISIDFKNRFLRWDRLISQKELEVPAHRTISRDDIDREIIGKAKEEAEHSSDWWRQVGAVIVKDGDIVLRSHNTHMPSPDAPYINGDPRGSFDAGERIDLCTAIHAEADLIASAAKEGISLEGASIYVTTFPCPNCARLIAQAGIKKVYYQDGYSLLDAEDILSGSGAEIILVKKETA